MRLARGTSAEKDLSQKSFLTAGAGVLYCLHVTAAKQKVTSNFCSNSAYNREEELA